jgi:hypothetical protein
MLLKRATASSVALPQPLAVTYFKTMPRAENQVAAPIFHTHGRQAGLLIGACCSAPPI